MYVTQANAITKARIFLCAHARRATQASAHTHESQTEIAREKSPRRSMGASAKAAAQH